MAEIKPLGARVVCPCCKNSMQLIFYPTVPLTLYPVDYGSRSDPIVTEHTDACCINCYWQGKVSELMRETMDCLTPLIVAKDRAAALLGQGK